MDQWERKMFDLIRRGQKSRVDYLKTMDKSILPSHLKRIQQNDKSVMRELVLPEWMDWDTLYEWSQRHRLGEEGQPCIFCGESMENGMQLEGKFVCENCFIKLKNM